MWNLTLRDGLRFHDGEPVLARDVVASVRRFAPRVIFAAALMDATDELSAPDDKTIRFRLKRRFPHLPEALAGPGGNAPVIMPERLAQESPFKPVSEIVGSGPYRFVKDEHVSGARAVFARFMEYKPREAAVGRRAVHPVGRVLAGVGLSQRCNRYNSRLLRNLLWRSPRLAVDQ